MGKSSSIKCSSVFCLVLAIWATAAAAYPNAETLCRGRQRFAKFHVFVQDIYGTASNATVWDVAEGKKTPDSDSYFGTVRVIDCQLTAGRDPNSKKLGRIQGLVAFTDINKISVTMNANFFFTTGRYKGSSLCTVGRNPMWRDYNRDLPIVGGTGVFINARGFTISNTVYANAEKTYHILEYFIYVVYDEAEAGCLEKLAREDLEMLAARDDE